MSIRLPFQEWGPTPSSINNKGLTLSSVADKGLIPLVCDVPLTSTGLACRPQSNPKGKPSRPKQHTFVLALFPAWSEGQQNTRRKGPMMNASRWLANTNKYFPAPKPNIKSHTQKASQLPNLPSNISQLQSLTSKYATKAFNHKPQWPREPVSLTGSLVPWFLGSVSCLRATILNSCGCSTLLALLFPVLPRYRKFVVSANCYELVIK